MNLPPPEPLDMHTAQLLIARLCDGQLTPEEAATLESGVIADQEIRRLYVLTLSLHADLYMQAPLLSNREPQAVSSVKDSDSLTSLHESMILDAIRDETDQAVQPLEKPVLAIDSIDESRTMRLKPAYWRWLAAGVAVAVGLSWALISHKGSRLAPVVAVSAGQAQIEQLPEAFARVDLALDTISVSGHPVTDGQRVATEQIGLTSGVARLVVDNGVVVVLDGSTELTLQSKSRLVLNHGKITLRVPHPATGFTVVTPWGSVTDVGTEFGVVSSSAGSAPNDASLHQSSVIVFDGVVRLDTHGAVSRGEGDQIARAGQAFTMTGEKIEPVPDTAALGSFIRNKDFERRKSSLNLAKAIVTNPDLLAYSFFDSDFDRIASQHSLQTGLRWRSIDGPTAVGRGGTSLGLGDQTGSTLRVHGGHAAMLDLDTTVNSQLGDHGYIGSSGCVKGSGKVIYLSWLAKADIAPPTSFGGLSLVYADQNQSSEYLTFGQVLEASNFACKMWKDGGAVSNPASRTATFELNSDTTNPQLKPVAVDSKMHLWVLKIQFGTANDQVSVFLDPGTEEPAQPNLSVQTADLQFNKIRMASGPGALWEFSRFLVGSSYDGVVPR